MNITCWMGEDDTSQECALEEPRDEKIVLPLEMLERIFQLLPARDPKTVILVCRWWKEAADNPKLWTHSVAFSYDMGRQTNKDLKFFQEVIRVRRLQTVRKIKIMHCTRKVSKTLIEGALQHPGLMEAHLEQSDISAIDPDHLSQFLIKMKEVNIACVGVTHEQAKNFLSCQRRGSLTVSGSNRKRLAKLLGTYGVDPGWQWQLSRIVH